MEREQKKRTFFKSLRGKITMRMLLVGLVPIVVIGLLVYLMMNQSQDSASDSIADARAVLQDDTIGSNLAETARGAAYDIDMFMDGRIREAMIWASTPTVVDTARTGYALAESMGLPAMTEAQIEATMAATRSLAVDPAADRFLKYQVSRSPHFGEIFFTDAHGYNVALTNKTSDFIQSGEAWWDNAWQNGIDIGAVEYDDSAGIWSMALAVRIDDPDTGTKVGVMKCVLGVSQIQEAADRAAEDVSGGQVVVMDPDGLLLAETESDHDLDRIMNPEVNMHDSGLAAVDQVYATPQANGYSVEDGTVVGYARSAVGGPYADLSGFDGFGWVVLVEQPENTAFAPLGSLSTLEDQLQQSTNSTLTYIAAVLAVVLAAAFALALWTSRRITDPINQLRDVADKVSLGDMGVTVAKGPDDEIGDLSDSFERMVTAVRFLSQDQEKRG